MNMLRIPSDLKKTNYVQMKIKKGKLIFLLAIVLISTCFQGLSQDNSVSLRSPDGLLEISFKTV